MQCLNKLIVQHGFFFLVLFLAGHDAVTSKMLETVRCIMCGAAPIGALDVERLQKK